MDDEDLFRQAMQSLGVSPLKNGKRRERRTPPGAAPAKSGQREARGRPRQAERRTPVVPDQEDALFLESMKTLGQAPDKDRVTRLGPTPAHPLEIRRLKASKSRDAEPEATLDLHGFREEEALRRLERFVAASASGKLTTLRVVTGKGLRSAGGVPILKEALERWLRYSGKKWVRAYSEAPRSLGGRGAYILYLR